MEKDRIPKLIELFCMCLISSLLSCSQPASKPPSLAELDKFASSKSPAEIGKFVFENYGCNGCHLPGKDFKLHFTKRGEQLRQQFEGCVTLLTAMNVLIHLPESEWTPEERVKYTHFQEYGCAFCHQVTPGRMGLTKIGTRLSSLHMSCQEVQQIISKR